MPITIRFLFWKKCNPLRLRDFLLCILGCFSTTAFADNNALETTATSPFYLSLWFVVGCALTLSGLLYLINFYNLKRIDTRKQTLAQQVKQRTVELEVLGEVGKALVASFDTEDIFNCLHEHINSVVNGYVFALGIVDVNNHLVAIDWAMEAGKRLPGSFENLADKNRLSVWCVNNGKEVQINQHSDNTKYIETIGKPKVGEAMESIVYLPLLAKNRRVIGVMTIQSPDKYAFNPAQLDILRTLAIYTAIALDNANAYREMEKQKQAIEGQKEEVQKTVAKRTAQLEQSNRSTAALNEICSEIGSTLNLSKLSDIVYNRIKGLMEVDAFGFGLYDAKTQR
jgi:transcriptional regulator with GAF, ATPase, and Fis domain